MPHKRNPKVAERISGLARVVRAAAVVGLENMPLWHERDISHSSAERIVDPGRVPRARLHARPVHLDRRRPRRLSGADGAEPLGLARPRSSRTGCCSRWSSRALDRARRVPARAAQRDARVGRGARLPRARRAPTPRSPRSSTRPRSTTSSTSTRPSRTSTPYVRPSPPTRHQGGTRPCLKPHARRQRQGPRALRPRRRAPAARRERPDLDLRRHPADRDPRQGTRAHGPLGVLVRADAATSCRTTCSPCARTAARPSAGGSRCCRSSASCAATSPGSGWKDYLRDRRGLRARAAGRARRVAAAARADLHAGDEGADRPRREHRPRRRGRARRRGALRRGRADRARALRVRLRLRARARDHPRRHEARVRHRRATAGSCSATRRSRPTRRASGRPTSTQPGGTPPSFDKQFVRDYCESLGWDKTVPGPRAARRRRRPARAPATSRRSSS